jgi:hypothetical protein
MSDKTIKVSQITIKIGDLTISLTPDQLKELKMVLDQMFPVVLIQHVHHIPYVPFYSPVIQPDPWWTKPTITCESSSHGMVAMTLGVNLR